MSRNGRIQLRACRWSATLLLTAASLSCSGHPSKEIAETDALREAGVSPEQEGAAASPVDAAPALSGPVLIRRSSPSAETMSPSGLDEPSACPKPPAQGIGIHIFSKFKTEQQVKKLDEMLAADGFAVLFTDTSGSGKLLVAIEGDLVLFKRVFKLRLVNISVPRSAYAGVYCQLSVKGYSLPARYRKLVEWLDVPDPQVY